MRPTSRLTSTSAPWLGLAVLLLVGVALTAPSAPAAPIASAMPAAASATAIDNDSDGTEDGEEPDGDGTNPLDQLHDQEAALVALADTAVNSTVKITAYARYPVPFPEELAPGDDSYVEVPVTYSGVVITPDGFIATVADAFAAAERFEVTLPDDRTLDAVVPTVDGTPCVDERSNIGLLKVEATGLTRVEFADSDLVRRGQFVLTCGNAFGMDRTISTGIVTGIDRTLWIGRTPFFGVIQTNCDINPGDPGGLALDSHGLLIGLMWSTYGRDDESQQGSGQEPPSYPGEQWPWRRDGERDGSNNERDGDSPNGDSTASDDSGSGGIQLGDSQDDSVAKGPDDPNDPNAGDGGDEDDPKPPGEGEPGDEEDMERLWRQMMNQAFRNWADSQQSGTYLQAQGINFILPASTLRRVVGELLIHGRVRRSQIGILVRPGEDDDDPGVIVRQVVRGGPAHDAGMERGDLLVRFDGHEINRIVDLYKAMSGCTPDAGEVHEIEVVRGGEHITLEITPTEKTD